MEEKLKERRKTSAPSNRNRHTTEKEREKETLKEIDEIQSNRVLYVDHVHLFQILKNKAKAKEKSTKRGFFFLDGFREFFQMFKRRDGN